MTLISNSTRNLRIIISILKVLSLIELSTIAACLLFYCLLGDGQQFTVSFLVAFTVSYYSLLPKTFNLFYLKWNIQTTRNKYLILFFFLGFLLALLLVVVLGDINYFESIYCDSEIELVHFDNLNSANTTDNPEFTSNSTEPESSPNQIKLDPYNFYHLIKYTVQSFLGIVTYSLQVIVSLIPESVMLGASAGLVSAPFFKVTSLLLWQKITLAAVTSGFLIFNLNTWKTALEGIGGRILSSSSANLGPNIPSSPTDFIISSMLEKTELLSPLEKLIKTQLSLDYLLLLFLIILTVLIFNKSFLTNSKTTSILNKILNENLSLKLENYKKIDIDIFNNLFFRVLFILIATSLIFNILINILINFELTLNLEYYIQSHENFKNSICFLLPLLVDLNKPELAQKGGKIKIKHIKNNS